ncbi:hypothetical protein [Spartinivicinus ruber]|uniref:hypothetical protein n=1 Tax=Spartinivicinus ruber TaxID=2683272 RepID=UPI0013D69C4F|nr:hypothetical protein [Spartinivicinus ruber]
MSISWDGCQYRKYGYYALSQTQLDFDCFDYLIQQADKGVLLKLIGDSLSGSLDLGGWSDPVDQNILV